VGLEEEMMDELWLNITIEFSISLKSSPVLRRPRAKCSIEQERQPTIYLDVHRHKSSAAAPRTQPY